MLIYGPEHQGFLLAWLRKQLPYVGDLNPCTAFGVVRDGKLVAVLAYNNYRPGEDIHVNMASTTPRWASKETISSLLRYPFIQLECRRITAMVLATNQPVRAFLCRLGFSEEGLHREYIDGHDAVSLGMLRHECRWLEECPDYRQRRTIPAARA